MNVRYLNGFLKRGIIKIGTSTEYRVPDGKDAGRADTDELIRVWHPGACTMAMDPDHPFIKTVLKGKKPSWTGQKMVTFEEGAKIAMHTSAYIFSASAEYTHELADMMAKKFDANACVCIKDPEKFISIISQHPSLLGRGAAADYVTYVDRTNEFLEYENTDPFKKLQKFDWQKEFRIVWGGDVPPKGTVIEAPDIIPLLSRIR